METFVSLLRICNSNNPVGNERSFLIHDDYTKTVGVWSPRSWTQDVLANFDFGESQVGQQPEFDEAQTKVLIKAPKQQDVQEVIMM